MSTDIDLERIRVYKTTSGEPLNPRGQVTYTVDLQDSMPLIGQTDAIKVYPVGDDFVVWDGHRRVVAARQMGWKTIRADIGPAPKDEAELLSWMIASDAKVPYKPTQLGRALQKLAVEHAWGIERAAKARGLKNTAQAQLYVDLLNAPESVQQRVDKGELGLTTFEEMRNKPRAFQEAVAALEKPTIRTMRQMAKHDKNKGVLDDLLEQMDAEHSLMTQITDLRQRLMGEWHTLTPGEQVRVGAMLEIMLAFTAQEAQVTS